MDQKNKIAKVIALVLASALALLWLAWLVVVPADLMIDTLAGELDRYGVSVEAEGFSKGLFYSVKCDRLTLGKKASPVRFAEFSDIRVSLSIPSVLMLKPTVKLDATAGAGLLEGSASAGLGGHSSVLLSARGVKLSELNLDRALVGVRAKGDFELDLNVVDGHGELRFSASDLDFLPYTYMGFALPLDLFRGARGLVNIKPGQAEIISATLDGDGIYARASGLVGKGRVDMVFEIMPSKELEQSQPYFAMISRYKVTDGHYSIPLRTSY